LIFEKYFMRLMKKIMKRQSYSGASTGRLYSSWASANYSADSEIRANLSTLRGRSRELERNNDYAKKFIRMVKTNVIGSKGIMLQSRVKDNNGSSDVPANNRIEEGFRRWAKKGNCDVTESYSFLDIQDIAMSSIARDGEVLIRLIKGFDNDFKFAVQLIEADHLDEKYNYVISNGNHIKMGIEFNTWGKAVAYHIFEKHPGDVPFGYSYGQRIRINADEILHLFIPERISQSRGIPWMHAAMTRLNMLGGYEEAELTAARVASAKGGFYTNRAGEEYTGDDTSSEGNPIQEVEPGTFETLPEGWDFKPWDPQHPTSQFEFFVKACLRGISSGLDVSYNYLANDLEGVNYSSIRAGVLDERDVWRKIQTWAINHFMQPIFENWLEMALLTQQVNLPLSKYDKFNAASWIARGWPWVDPKSDMIAAISAIKMGLNTASNIVGEQGRDLEEIYQMLAEEQKLREKWGVKTEWDLKMLETLLLEEKTEA